MQAVLGPPSLGPQRPGGWSSRNPSSSNATIQGDKDKKRSNISNTKRSGGDKGPGGRGSGSAPKRSSSSDERAAALEAVAKLTNNPKPVRSSSGPAPKTHPPPPPEVDALDAETVRRKACTIVDELVDNADIKVMLCDM